MKTWVASLAMLVLSAYGIVTAPGYQHVDQQVTVVDRLYVEGKRTRLVLVYQDAKGRLADMDVTPAFYSQAKVGEQYTVNLMQHPDDRTSNQRIFLVACMVAAAFSIVTLVLSLFGAPESGDY